MWVTPGLGGAVFLSLVLRPLWSRSSDGVLVTVGGFPWQWQKTPHLKQNSKRFMQKETCVMNTSQIVTV